jgi:uncharacterized protein YdeI (YjbR/CyaY-like superfamily)
MRTRQQSAAEKPVLTLADKARWATWLARNHGTSSGVWLRLAKRTSGVQSISHGDALDLALCYGWIDGQAKSEDERYWLVKFTPRGRRSIWSKRNREKALAMIAGGDMKPAGLAEVERAKSDGRWDRAYDPPSRITVPDDLQAALDRNSRAAQFFRTLNGQNRYAILFRIQTAHKAETRAKRIQQFIQMLSRGEKIYP